MSDFTVTLSEKADENNGTDDTFIVTFAGKFWPGKRGLGTANRVPGSVTYFICRDNWKIVKEQGIK
jgi:hypothetical protein